jgi:hypothetical protein
MPLRFRVLLALAAAFAAMLPAASAQALPPGAVNAVFASTASDKAVVAGVGFNAVTVNPYKTDLDAIAARGLRGIVWLGGYDNTLCQFSKNDTWIRDKVGAIRNHPAVIAYHIDDEPHGTECPAAPSQIRARSALVKSIDPDAVTVLTHYRDYEFARFAGSADVLGIVSYPCSWTGGCKLTKITDKVKAARAAGWTRLWGLPQTFGDEYYRMPSPAEFASILSTWDSAGVGGMFTYTWDKTDPDTLSLHPELWSVMRARTAL